MYFIGVIIQVCLLYLLQTRCAVLDILGQKDDHAELIPFVRQLDDLSHRFQTLAWIFNSGYATVRLNHLSLL